MEHEAQGKRHRISPETTGLARQLRRKMTAPEIRVWNRLRRARLKGRAFRRQHPIGRYFADFFCATARLVVELDGRSHEGRQAEDAERQAYFESRGLRVIRFSNDDALKDTDAVIAAIVRAVGLKP